MLSEVKLDNYSGVWCVEPTRFSQLVDRVNRMNLTAHIQAQEVRSLDMNAAAFGTTGGGSIAVIDIRGTMTKAGSSLGGGSTVEARRAIRQANADPNVSQILLRFDSPGGNVSGTADLARDVKNSQKPVTAFVEDLCCSAAMWVASQATAIWANDPTAMVGSIGTFMGLYDISKALDNEGVRAVVVKAGEFKGGGFPGMEISDAQVAEWQKRIDGVQKEFTAAIASGRNMTISEAEQLVTGLTYLASEAVGMKLIDGIKTFDEVVNELKSKPAAKGNTMSETQPATYKQIVSACPGIDPKTAEDALFINECLKGECSADDAAGLYCSELQDRLKAAAEKHAELADENSKLKAENEELKAAAAAKKPGAKAVGTGVKTETADAATAWKAAIEAKVASGMARDRAVMAVNKEQPELREAILAK